jgi:hypothetical protein
VKSGQELLVRPAPQQRTLGWILALNLQNRHLNSRSGMTKRYRLPASTLLATGLPADCPFRS